MAQSPLLPGPGPRRPATIADWEAVPAPFTAHLIDGELHVMSKPKPMHSMVQGGMTETLLGPFHRGRGGPGGWLLLQEVDIRLGRDIVAPDMAGWRRERMAQVPTEAPITLAPDWVCEVLSPGTEVFDRKTKADWYARSGVGWMWLVDPADRMLEVFRNDSGTWRQEGVWRGDDEVKAAPFDALAWSLGLLWS